MQQTFTLLEVNWGEVEWIGVKWGTPHSNPFEVKWGKVEWSVVKCGVPQSTALEVKWG